MTVDHHYIYFIARSALTMHQNNQFSPVLMSKCRVLESRRLRGETCAKYVHLLILKLCEVSFGQVCPFAVALQSFDQQYGSRRTRLASEALSSTIFLGPIYHLTIYNTVVRSTEH